ncbi:MAG: RsmE family RNA methyltransferase [Planctomycetes bacterium]|nr:RsmE family RNA methyltransferase [Planctomycetota bacterium]
MSRHIIYLPQAAFSADSRLVIRDDEAHHAVRVRRLVAGDHVLLSDGKGLLAEACITETRKRGRDGWEVEVAVEAVNRPTPILPRLTVFAAPPKGDRLSEMIDGLSQTGAAAWRPLASQRAQGDSLVFKAERLERIAAESLKQCSRATLMEIGPTATLDEALIAAPRTIIADAGGAPYVDEGSQDIAL